MEAIKSKRAPDYKREFKRKITQSNAEVLKNKCGHSALKVTSKKELLFFSVEGKDVMLKNFIQSNEPAHLLDQNRASLS